MPTTAHGAPYPSTLDAPDGAAQVMALATWADQHGVFYATSSADRDARYGDLPVGALVSSGVTGDLWQKTGTASTWIALYSDTGWITTGFTAQPNWVASTVRGRQSGSTVEIRGEFTRTGPDLVATSTGSLIDELIVTAPPLLSPSVLAVTGVGRSSNTSGTVQITTDGSINLLDLHSNSAIGNGTTLRLSLTFLAG